MFEKSSGATYYVSNLGTGMVSIIDGDSYSVIKEIEIGPRPLNIIVDEKNNVYVASDRNNKITLIHDLYDIKRTWNMPNNGNIQVDLMGNKMYVSDTEEVCIYDLSTGVQIGCITGFTAADSLKLNKDKKRLFILDVIQNELKVYDTSDFHLIAQYNEVGINPKCIEIGADEKEIFIANKGTFKGINTGSISVLNLESGRSSFIDFPKGSSITDLKLCGDFLYAVNSGRHQIEVIDLLKRKRIGCIKTTLQKPQRICISPDLRTLLATCCDDVGSGAVDRIDVSTNAITDTLFLEQSNSMPFDIAVVSEHKPAIEIETCILYDSEDKARQNSENAILAKKILSSYQEKVFFPEVIVKMPSKEQETVKIGNIVFQQCEIVKGTENKAVLDNRKDYLIFEYEFYIPYFIEIVNERGQKRIIEERLKGKQKATVYIPDYTDKNEVQFAVKSYTKLTANPVVRNDEINLAVSSLIMTKVIVEDVIFIPDCKNCQWRK